MALTLKRWVALALAGFVLAPVVVLEEHEPRGWESSRRDRLAERNQVAQQHARRAANQLRILRIRDSVLRVAAGLTAPDAGEVETKVDAVTQVWTVDQRPLPMHVEVADEVVDGNDVRRLEEPPIPSQVVVRQMDRLVQPAQLADEADVAAEGL